MLDFGIARQRGGLSEVGGLKIQTGAILGTPYYISPEQATGQGVDHLTDVWAYGVIGSECITGRRAFDSESRGGLFRAICIAPMPVPSQLGEIPVGFDEWFARCSARDKSQRFQTIKEASAELRVVCGRVSGLMSGGVYPSLRGGAPASQALPARTGNVQDAPVAAPPVFQTTAVPSARSIPRLPQPSTKRKWIVLASVAAIGLIGLLVGWRAMSSEDSTSASAAAATESAPVIATEAPVAPSQIVAAAVGAATVPAAAEKADAGVQLDVSKPKPVVVAKRRAAPPRPKPALPPSAVKAQPPAPVVKKPPAPVKRDDNAAGI